MWEWGCPDGLSDGLQQLYRYWLDRYHEQQYGHYGGALGVEWEDVQSPYWQNRNEDEMQAELYHTGIDLQLLGYERDCLTNERHLVGWDQAKNVRYWMGEDDRLLMAERMELAQHRFWSRYGDAVRQMTAEASHHGGREKRAVDIVMNGMVHIDPHDRSYRVESSSQAGRFYTVRPDEYHCSCPDSARHRGSGTRCKHQIGVIMALKLRKQIRQEG